MIDLYLDEDSSSRALIAALRALGVNVESAIEAGLRTKPDPEHLAHAASANRAICTRNVRDFGQLHGTYVAEKRSHAGIVILPTDGYSIGRRARALALIAGALSPEEMCDQLVYLTDWL